MAAVCSPVSVVTTTVDGAAYGTTVSAFTSLSMAPPMVLVSFDNGSQSLHAIRATRTFGLNVLSSGQAAYALAFAKKGGAEKFDSCAWSMHEGVPRLDDVCAFLRCEVEAIVNGGDHRIVLGRVVLAEVLDAAPLTYHNRSFGTHQPL